MSQTSGEPGQDPEREAWLKQFQGLPGDERPGELNIERPEYQPFAAPRSDNVNIYDARPATNDHVFHDPKTQLDTGRTGPQQRFRRFFFGAILATVVVVAVAGLVF
jgi:hypothetical protein